MHRCRNLLALAVSVLSCSAGQAHLGVESESHYYGTGYHLFRGRPLGPAGFVQQDDMHYSFGRGLSVGLGTESYFALSGRWRNGESRYAPRLDYQPPALPVAVRVGYTYYGRLKWLGGETGEFTARVTGRVPFSPYLEASYDHHRNVGLHLRGGVQQDWPLGEWGTLATSASVGFNSRRLLDTFNDVQMRLAWQVPVGRRFFVEPALDVVVPSHQLSTYGARLSPTLGVGYRSRW